MLPQDEGGGILHEKLQKRHKRAVPGLCGLIRAIQPVVISYYFVSFSNTQDFA
jgi:hypothetical protein